ncbi:MAG: CHASE3 domain-containing protein [Candidatus Obscuribacter sp.]|nr:CHASE3 domain-containing protein [Candidatus Obscuribacter sp.]
MRLNLNLKISHKGFILVLVPLVFELVFLIILSVLLQKAEEEVQRQVRSKAIISQANALSKLFYDAGVAMGGYSITKSPLFSDRYDKIVRQIPLDLGELSNLVGDNDKQQQILVRLKTITSDGLKILGEAKSAIDDNRVDVAQFRARLMYKQIRQLADQLQDELKGLTEDERKIENEARNNKTEVGPWLRSSWWWASSSTSPSPSFCCITSSRVSPSVSTQSQTTHSVWLVVKDSIHL